MANPSPDEGVRAALEEIIAIDQHESRVCVDYDPAGSTYAVTKVDGPCAEVARKTLAALSTPVPVIPMGTGEGQPRGSASAAARVINDNQPGSTAVVEVLTKPATLGVGTLLYAHSAAAPVNEDMLRAARNALPSPLDTEICDADLEDIWEAMNAVLSAELGSGAASALPSPLPSQGEPVADLPNVRGVDPQVITLAANLTAEQKRQPEWLWRNHDTGVLSFGRWPKPADLTPYVRADLVLEALAAAEARADRAEEALKPFAKDADEWADSVHDDHRSLCTEPGSTVAYKGSETTFTVGDLRRARTILKETPHDER